jgi:hypothetical protein
MNNTDGGSNTAIGLQALVDNTIGDGNVAIGNNALSNSQRSYIYSLDVSESAASGIVEKRSRAHGCVAAGGVGQKGGSADSRIFVSGVQYQRSSANTGIEAASGNALERKPTNCCVGSASRQTEKGVLPFGRGEVGINPVGRGNHRLCLWQKT